MPASSLAGLLEHCGLVGGAQKTAENLGVAGGQPELRKGKHHVSQGPGFEDPGPAGMLPVPGAADCTGWGRVPGLTKKQEMVYVSAIAKVSARAGAVNGATADQLACLDVPEVLTAEGQ